MFTYNFLSIQTNHRTYGNVPKALVAPKTVAEPELVAGPNTVAQHQGTEAPLVAQSARGGCFGCSIKDGDRTKRRLRNHRQLLNQLTTICIYILNMKNIFIYV